MTLSVDQAGDPTLRLERRGIERASATVELHCDGRPIEALESETIAAALTAAGIRTLRSSTEGGPRGLYCGMGVCAECRVTINGRPGQRACLSIVKQGMQVLTGDQPVETVGESAQVALPRADQCAILVIGAGPAGLAAALSACEGGAVVVVLDERPASGGQYFKPLASSHRFQSSGAADRQFAEGTRLVAQVHKRNARIFNNTSVWDVQVRPEGGVVVRALDTHGPLSWACEKLIVATGAYERSWAVPGWTLPGVMTTGAAQTLSRAYRVAPGRRVLFAGNGPLNLQVAADLAASGVKIVAIAEGAAPISAAPPADVAAMLRTRPDLLWKGAAYLRVLGRHRIPVLYRHVLVRVEGNGQVERAVVARIDHEGLVIPDSERAFEVDTVCTGYGFAPSSEITRLLGCRHYVDARNGATLIAVRDKDGRTTLNDVFIAGDAGGAFGAHAALHQGAIAGAAAAKDLGAGSTARVTKLARARRGLAREQAFQASLWRVFSMPDMADRLAQDDTLVCRCENVTFGQVRGEIANGAKNLALIKRATRCGMGPCQGRYCSMTIACMLAQSEVKVEEATFFRSQTPIKPVPMIALAMQHADRASAPLVEPTPLPTDAAERIAEATTLVIGGGVIGLSVARELSRLGHDVAVLERGEPHAEASGVNAGSLHVQFQTFGFPDLGVDAARSAASTLALQRDSVYLWDELSSETSTDFEIAIEGGLTVADDAPSVAHLREKVAIERRAGLAIDLLPGDEARRLAPYLSSKVLEASLSRDEGKLNPLKAAPAVLASALGAGVRLFSHSHVLGIDRTDSGFVVRTLRGTFFAKRIVNAAGAWAGSVAALAGDSLPVKPNPIQMLVTERMRPMIPYHLAHATRRLTLKQAASGNLVIGGGWKAIYDPASQRMRPSVEGFCGNLAVVLELLPRLGELQVIRSWTGTAFTTPPVIGESSRVPGLFHAIAQNGMTLGPAIGRIVAGQIIGRAPEYDLAPFSPRRFK